MSRRQSFTFDSFVAAKVSTILLAFMVALLGGFDARAAAPSVAWWTLTVAPSPKHFTGPGQVINYTYVITSSYGSPGFIDSLTDDKVTITDCPAHTTVPLAGLTCHGSYTTTAADVSNGSITDHASVSGDACSDGCLTSATAQATISLSNRPAWRLTKTAQPKTYTAAGQTIDYSYLLTNTGNVSISAISLTDDKISAVSCPATSLGVGAIMTCSGSYVTTKTDVANHRVVNTAIASGTPAGGSLAPAKAQAAIKFVATSGSITIVTTASRGNGTFSFTSTLPAAKAFSLTTVSGRASRRFSHVKPGTYIVSERNLPLYWKLAALSCSGDTGGRPTMVDLGNRRVSIGLDSNEAVTCTFGNANDGPPVIKKTKDVIARFLGHRLEMLLDEEPDRARFLRRVPGALWGTPNQDSSGDSGRPFNFTGASTGLGSDINFSTSMMQISRASAHSDEKNGAANGKNALASMPAKVTKPPILLDPGVDVWMEAHYKSYSADSGGVQNNGYFGILYLGADYLVTPSTLIGALVQFDWMKENSSSLGTMVDGRGGMAGPYLSLRLAPNLFFDSRIAWGLSRNDINPLGRYTDTFSTDRWLAHARLTGNWHFGDFRVTPSVAFDYGQEDQQSYTDSNGLLIPAQLVSLGRISFGPEFARRFMLGNGTIVEPLVSLTGKWDFANGTYAAAAGLPADGESFYLKVAGGFLARSLGGYSWRLVGTYDGVGNAAFQSWGGEVSVNIPLN